MSYILEALRRAERERGGAAPAPQIVSQGGVPQIMAPRRAMWPFLLLGFALALMSTGLVLVLTRQPAPPAAPPPVAAPTPPPPVPVASAAPSGRAETLSGPAAESLDDLLDPDGPPPAALASSAPEPVAEELPPEPAAAAVAAEETAGPQVETIELDPAPEPPTPQLKDMPAEFRAEFPKLNVDVHAYDDDPARRFCMVNGRRYREGDSLSEGPRIAEITLDGIIFNFRGSDVFVAVGY